MLPNGYRKPKSGIHLLAKGLLMLKHAPEFVVRMASTPDDIHAAQRLRYDVFVTELGGDGDAVDHAQRIEVDQFDAFAGHLLLEDKAPKAPRRLVGVYRLMTETGADAAGGFYSETEFDLSKLVRQGRRLLELGRSCLHSDYRGGAAMLTLWSGLAAYILENDIEILFGVASFHGTDVDALAQPLAYLQFAHSAPPEMTAYARAAGAISLGLLPENKIDRKAAMLATPPLIKAYLRLGGVVGEGAFADHAFNTTDVCLILDISKMDNRLRAQYSQGAPK